MNSFRAFVNLRFVRRKLLFVNIKIKRTNTCKKKVKFLEFSKLRDVNNRTLNFHDVLSLFNFENVASRECCNIALNGTLRRRFENYIII